MKKKPNILFVCSDQHSCKVLGSYGNNIISTPNLNKLSQEGTQFDSAYCNCPLCVPSRMSFLTGKYPFNCEVLNNGAVLDSRVPTFAHMLAGAGYHTVLSGRMHFNGHDQLHGFVERLVGDIMPYAFYGLNESFPSAPLPGDLGHMEKPDPLLSIGGGSTSLLDYDNAVTNATCNWLKSYKNLKSEQPFLMVAGLFNPHCPYIAPPELFQKYKSKVSIKPLSKNEYDSLHPFHQRYLDKIEIGKIPAENLSKAAGAYYGLVEFIDQRIGKIFKALKDSGLEENTIIIYSSDHGEMLGEHGRWHKGCFYEASSRIPLIIKVPWIKGGKRISTPVSLVDLLPTMADFCGAQIPCKVDGRNLAPLISGKNVFQDRPVFTEYYDGSNANRMVRLQNWKLNYYGKDNSYELFDLNNDKKEDENIYPLMKHSDIFKDLKSMLFRDKWHKNIGSDYDKKMNKMGYWRSRLNFSKGLSKDTLLNDIPGYWKPIKECKNVLYDK